MYPVRTYVGELSVLDGRAERLALLQKDNRWKEVGVKVVMLVFAHYISCFRAPG